MGGGGGCRKGKRRREGGNQGKGLHFAFLCVPDTILSANQKQVGGKCSKCAKTKKISHILRDIKIFPRT